MGFTKVVYECLDLESFLAGTDRPTLTHTYMTPHVRTSEADAHRVWDGTILAANESRPFVYTYPGQMYAIRSITVRYPERFENYFKGGQAGCLDLFSSSVNGVPGYPDRFWIQFSMAKKNSSRLFTCRACSLSGAFRLIFVFDFLYFHSLPPVSSKKFFDR